MKAVFKLVTISLLLTSIVSFAQVTENINFDNYVSPGDNDHVNHFYGMQSLIQIPTNGITGGCLQTPDSNNWGNDNSRYCSRYTTVQGQLYTTSICFYYVAPVVPSGFERKVSIWLQPSVDPNHYIISTVSNAGKIEIYTYYSFTSSPLIMQLQSHHWYLFECSFILPTAPNPFDVSYSAKVYSLGSSGTSTPVYVDSIASNVIDTAFASDPKIEVSITGAHLAGTDYLDNFTFSGMKSADSCLFTDIRQPQNFSDEIKVNSTNDILTIEGNNLADNKFEIYDLAGKVKRHSTLYSDQNRIDISDLSSGIYFLEINNSTHQRSLKFSVIK